MSATIPNALPPAHVRPHTHPPPAPDSPSLLEAFRAGDDTAFAQIVARHELPLRRTIRRLLAWSPDIDPADVVQDVFLAALKHRRNFRADASLHTWLTAIALRRCRSEQRKWWKHFARRVLLPADPVSASPAPDHDDTAAEVRRAVQRLPHRDREVIVLYYLEQLPGPQIAHLLDLTPGAVDVRLHRARARLKQLLQHLA